MVTLNSTSGKSGETAMGTKQLRHADIFLMQEHRWGPDQAAYARKRLRQQMWHGCVEPAVPTAKGGNRGGVAVFSRCWINQDEPFELKGSVICPGRLILRLVHAVVPGGLLVGSIYLPVDGGARR